MGVINNFIRSGYFGGVKIRVSSYLQELKNYHFSWSNPLFWLLLLIALFILSRRWGLSKAGSFCLLIGLVLLGTTEIEMRIGDALVNSGLFDAGVLRLVSLFVIAMITLYYLFIKDI